MELLASLDGKFGKEQTPEGLKDIRDTPAYATEVESGAASVNEALRHIQRALPLA